MSLTTIPARRVCHQIVENRQIAVDSFLLSFEDPFFAEAVQPGQFLMISLPHLLDPLLPRPFALFDVDGSRLEVVYRIVGKGTGLLSQVRKGDELALLGPLGKGFTLPRPGVKPLVLAGGIGIASVHLLLRRLLESGFAPRLLYGARQSRELLPLEGLKREGLDMLMATEDGREGYHGSLAELFDSLYGSPEDAEEAFGTAYVCGPPAMLKYFAQKFDELGVRAQMSLESRMACGFGVCQGCAVSMRSKEEHAPHRYGKVCTDGPVFAAEDVLWDSLP